MPESKTIVIRPARFVRTASLVGAVIFLLGIVVQEIRISGQQISAFGLASKFYLNAENTIPNYFSSAMLVVAAGVLGAIAAVKRRGADRFAGHWKLLAIFFVFLSVDEAASLHELTIQPIRYFLGVGGILYFAWVIPGLGVLVAFTLYFRKFFFGLPPRFRRLFATAAVLCVGGAIGLELLGGLQADLHGEKNMAFVRLATIEEGLEISGILVFVYALLEYARVEIGTVRFSADNPAPEGSGPDAGDSFPS